ncbi:MAG TPA: N-acetylmuramoyl-L-alanine amidase [Sphingomicrobium sp.]|nr:N-acetylmuramoyl-L-alanine amidase [Sphingomicrobium sp.]
MQGAAGAGLTMVGAVLATLALNAPEGGEAAAARDARIGEARAGQVTVALPETVSDVQMTEARAPGRPIVLIDPGHGGRDPGATAVSGVTTEKQLTLVMARELRDLLARRGRVRVALTRDSDKYLTLDQRADLASRLGASLYLSLHMDSAPNPTARGASVYSLSDVASDVEAARFARVENAADGSQSQTLDGSVVGMLADLALREQMTTSADLAERLVRKAAGRVLLRPEPHRFAAFHVLGRARVPAVLFEAGYVSNADDEISLMSPAGRKPIVAALADAIEADVATRSAR